MFNVAIPFVLVHEYTLFSEPDRTGRSDRENRFFKPKEPDFLVIPWTVKTGVGPQELVRTVRSNPLANFFLKTKKKKQLNTILFYLSKLSISYKKKKIIIKILQRYSTLLQKLIINFNVFMVIILFYAVLHE